MMDHQKKLDFVLKMTKHALESVQHFDSGGTALTGPATAGTPNGVNAGSQGLAGGIGNALGTNNNFQASGAQITPGTNVAQLNNAYTGTQNALGQANNLTSTLTPGVSQGANSQNLLTQQLQNEAAGRGPNPAQSALNQNTGQNIAQAAALAASTRGAGSNAGLIASNAAQTGANTQQQAVGQGATLQAQQALAAQNQLQNLASTQVNQGTNAVQLNNQTQQNEQNILQGANTAANNANVSQQENINTTNAAVAQGNQNANQNVLGGIGKAINSAGSFLAGAFAKGGKVPPHLKTMAEIWHPHLAEGGAVWQNSTPVSSPISSGPTIPLPGVKPTDLAQDFTMTPSVPSSPMTDEEEVNKPGGLADALGPDAAASALSFGYAKGGDVGKRLKSGGKVPGKPKVDHDSRNNDTVDAKLSPGEVVIDINTLKDKGKLGQMARFVARNIERKKMGRAP